jgi:hypothetical protein
MATATRKRAKPKASSRKTMKTSARRKTARRR